MTFEWDPKKSVRNKEKHGVAFEWVEEAIFANGLLAVLKKESRPGQRFLVFRGLDHEIYEAATEQRGESIRLISAHRSRKMEKLYGL